MNWVPTKATLLRVAPDGSYTGALVVELIEYYYSYDKVCHDLTRVLGNPN